MISMNGYRSYPRKHNFLIYHPKHNVLECFKTNKRNLERGRYQDLIRCIQTILFYEYWSYRYTITKFILFDLNVFLYTNNVMYFLKYVHFDREVCSLSHLEQDNEGYFEHSICTCGQCLF